MLIARGVGPKSLLRGNRRRGPLPTLHLVRKEHQRIKVTAVCSVSQHCTRGVLQTAATCMTRSPDDVVPSGSAPFPLSEWLDPTPARSPSIGELRKVPKKRELTVIRKFRSWLTKRILFTVVAGVVSHVWMAPDLQEICCVRLGRLRSCVRPIDAIGYGPLALMGSADRGLISLSGLMSH
jgi:hypothetical protein